jgi:hypothetical protein
MASHTFNVRFVTGPKLRANERYWPWDEDCGGTASFDLAAIRLTGKRKTGAAVDLLTLGPAQQLLKNSVAGDMTEVISAGDLIRVVVRQTPGKKTAAFRFYQRREDGTVAVHPIVTGLMKGDPDPADVIAAIVAAVPASIVTDEAGTPVAAGPVADWYPDPAGGHQLRYWDGTRWTAHVSDDGQQSTDVLP